MNLKYLERNNHGIGYFKIKLLGFRCRKWIKLMFFIIGSFEPRNPRIPSKKVKCSRYRPDVVQRVGRGTLYSSMTAALEGGEWSAARPGRTLPPGKSRYPFYRRLGGPQGWSGRAENLVPTGIRSRTVQLVVSHYTDWATWPTGPQVGALVTTWELFPISYIWVGLQMQKNCEIKKGKLRKFVEENIWQ